MQHVLYCGQESFHQTVFILVKKTFQGCILVSMGLCQIEYYTAVYFRSSFNNKPAFNNIFRCHALCAIAQFYILFIDYGKQVYCWKIKAYKLLCRGRPFMIWRDGGNQERKPEVLLQEKKFERHSPGKL